MKKAIGVVLIIIFLLLDFAALDDITTGNEPNYYGEYAILAVSIPIFFLIFKWAFGKKQVDKKTKIIIFPLAGGMLGFGIHLAWHFLLGIELFYYGSHVVSGVIYTLLGTIVGTVLYLVVSKK